MTGKALEIVHRTLQMRARHLCGIIDKNRARFGDEWDTDFEQIVGSVFRNQEDLQLATIGYAAFANSALRSQARFQKKRQYEYNSFSDVAKDVYLNPEYMHKEYLPGLLLSHLLWPHHYAQLRFYRQVVEKIKPRKFAEIGVGSGVYSLVTLLTTPSAVGMGVDISPSSLHYAHSLLEKVGCENRYQLLQRDVSTEAVDLSIDLVISVELLEHLEQPESLLQGLRKSVRGESVGFITAALNAAHTDHIYLYSTVQEVESQIQDAGFSIRESFFEKAYEPRNSNELVPSVAAFVVTAS